MIDQNLIISNTLAIILESVLKSFGEEMENLDNKMLHLYRATKSISTAILSLKIKLLSFTIHLKCSKMKSFINKIQLNM